MKRFYIHTMGCKSNQFESSIIAENLTNNGMVQTKNIEDADIFVLNSCTVTHKSDSEAFYIMRNAKNKNPNIKNIITGCIAQVEKDKLLEEEFVDFVIGNDEKLHLYEYINDSKRLHIGNIMEQELFNKTALLDTHKTRASLKIQDGCDNRCSYCIIPFARGKSRSADVKFITSQISSFVQADFKEIVLTGIHIGQWGKDISSELLTLLKEIEKTDIKRYRLGSLNPLEISDELLEFLSKSTKFCPHFHLSLQSACNKTLKSMNRFYTVEDYLKLIDGINATFNFPFIGSDVIVGFAGETEEDFEITRKNLDASGLTQIHTFPYSIRNGTVGAQSANQVDGKTKESRAKIIRSISSKKYAEFIKKNIGNVQEILIEKNPDKKTGNLKGVTRNYLTVIANSKDKSLVNTLQNIKITHCENNKIYGELIKP